MKIKSVVHTSAWIASLGGAAFLLSWHFGIAPLLRLPPTSWPIPYISALCLLLAGLSLFTLFSSNQIPIPNVLGGAIFLLSFQRAAELLFPLDFKLNLLFNHFDFQPIQAPRMVTEAAIGYMLVGIVLLCWRKEKRYLVKNILLLMLSIAVTLLGSVGIFTGILPIKMGESPARIFMHFYSASGLFLIGLALVFARFYKSHFTRLPQKKD